MEKVPPTEKDPLEKVKNEIEKERREWEKAGITANMTVHPPASLWSTKIKLRALLDLLQEKGIITEEELELTFAEIQLEEMQQLRGIAADQRKATIVPKMTLLDRHGKEINL